MKKSSDYLESVAGIGTPKNLDEALRVIVSSVPSCHIQEMGYAILRDYLAQRFGVYMLKYPGLEDEFRSLFLDITRRDVDGGSDG